MVTSHDRAMARNFSCGTYYGVCSFYFETYSNYILAGGDDQLYGALADYCNFNPNAPQQCGLGTPMSGTVRYSWSVGATNIISTSQPSIAEPMLNGISAGTGYARVTASAGQCSSSGGGNPTVQVPTASRIVSTVSNGAATNCPSGQAGWDRNVTKIVTDQENPPQDIVAANQSLTENYTVSPNPFGITSVQTSTATTNSEGLFGDNYFICSTLCPNSTAQMNASQVITDVYQSKPYTLTANAVVYSCSNITVNGK